MMDKDAEFQAEFDKHYDADWFYDSYRDMEGSDLDMALKQIWERFVVKGEKPLGYYKNSPDKFLDHATTMLGWLVEDFKKKREEMENVGKTN